MNDDEPLTCDECETSLMRNGGYDCVGTDEGAVCTCTNCGETYVLYAEGDE